MDFITSSITALMLLISGPAVANDSSAKVITLNTINHVLLRSEVDDASMSRVARELTELVRKRGADTYPIYLVLDSPGGSIDAGLNFIEYAKTLPNIETITLFSASMAAGIVEALPGKRNITETGILMFHRARGGVEGQFESGELESRLDLYKRIVRGMEIKNANRMSMSLDAYKTAVKDELWILGTEAVSKKAADEQVSIVCAPELLKGSTIEKFSIMGLFTVNVKFSNCPLLRGGEVSEGDDKAKKAYVNYRKEKYSVGTK